MKQSNNIKNSLSGFNYRNNGISVFVCNNRDLYCMLEALCGQCVKVFRKCGGLDLDILCNCSSLKAITRAARRRLASFGESWTMADDIEARRALVAYIFEYAQSEI